jgi:hypothetical protein
MNRLHQELIAGLPGAERIVDGLRDYHEKRDSIGSCLVRIARRRLARAGFVEASPEHDIHAELDLYQLLSPEGNQAHSRYNALIRELVSFEHALDHRLRNPACQDAAFSESHVRTS